MPIYKVQLKLLSATTFGRGDGVAGFVDREVEHDAFGLPVLRGRTLKGLLAEECANILYTLDKQGRAEHWRPIAHKLFGSPGSVAEDIGAMRVGDGRPPKEFRDSVKADVELFLREGPATLPLNAKAQEEQRRRQEQEEQRQQRQAAAQARQQRQEADVGSQQAEMQRLQTEYQQQMEALSQKLMNNMHDQKLVMQVSAEMQKLATDLQQKMQKLFGNE